MSYTKNTWKAGDTLFADKLNHIESGIEEVSLSIEGIDTGMSEEAVQALVSNAVAVKLDTSVYDAEKTTFALKTELPDVSGFALKSDVYTKAEVDGLVSSAMTYMGTVETFDSLPSDAKMGDLYNVADTGINYAWDGEQWDALSGVVDLSGYLTKEEAEGTYATKGEIPDISVKLDTSVYEADKPTFALKTEIPSLDGLATVAFVEEGFQPKGDYQPVGDYALKSEIPDVSGKLDTSVYNAEKAAFALKSEIPDVSGFAEKSTVETLASDVNNIGNVIIPEMNTNTAKALDIKVDWDAEKKVISLPMDGSISARRNAETLEGGVLVAQRSYDDNVTFVTELGTTKNKLTLNASERPQVDIQGGDSQKVAYLSDIPSVEGLVSSEQLNTKLGDYATTEVVEAEFASYDKTIVALDDRIEALEGVAVTTAELPIALKSFTNKVHEKAEILGWFGVENEAGLKSIIASKQPIFVRYGISLSGQPRYYKFPAEYVAFESNTKVKLVFEGLDTSDDSVVRYTILMNLDGTLIGEQSNISMVLEPMGTDVSNLATKEEVQAKADAKHNHEIADVSGLQDALDGKQSKGDYALKSELTSGLEAKADSEHAHELADVIDITKLVNPTFLTYDNPSETVQYLPKLEQSYVDELLQHGAEQGLVTINGQPWNAETNNWTIGMPYVVFGHINDSFTFEANLWEADAEHLGVVFNQIKSMISTFYTEYQSKVKSIEARLKALEEKGS